MLYSIDKECCRNNTILILFPPCPLLLAYMLTSLYLTNLELYVFVYLGELYGIYWCHNERFKNFLIIRYPTLNRLPSPLKTMHRWQCGTNIEILAKYEYIRKFNFGRIRISNIFVLWKMNIHIRIKNIRRFIFDYLNIFE